MTKHFLIQILVVLCGAIGAAAQTVAEYHVTFDGIIMHNLTDIAKARALIVRGTDDMPHQAILVTPPDIDIDALRAAIGKHQSFSCNPQECRFRIDAVALRIGTADASVAAPGPLNPTDSFRNYTPHMRGVTQGSLLPVVNEDLPSGPVAAYFELVGGSLSACTFPGSGFFFPDYDRESERKFADKVSLDGSVATGSVATLHVRSYVTKGQWVAVPRIGAVRKPLVLKVENHAPPENGKVAMSNRHFAINEQLIETMSPFPSVCVTTVGAGDDPKCPTNLQYATPRGARPDEAYLPGPLDNALDCISSMESPHTTIAATRKTAKRLALGVKNGERVSPSSGGDLDLVAGCANSTWP